MAREFAPNFHRRYFEQIAFEKSVLAGRADSPGGITMGRYSTEPLFPGLCNPDVTETFRDLRGKERSLDNLEILLARQIRGQLAVKPPERPVTVLDIGGGAGESWSKLGLLFEQDVHAGNLALVVSNIKGEPHDYAKPYTPTGRFITETSGLVQYVTGTFSQIGEQHITLSDGSTMPLAGNVDIVHEQLSLTAWSKIPEWDILEIPPLLSQQGIYIMDDLDMTALEGWAERGEEEYNERVEGIQLAHARLQTEFGLTRITEAEQGNQKGNDLRYIIFKNKNAPQVALSI